MFVGIRNIADMEREDQPPGRFKARDIVGAALSKNRANMNDRHTQLSDAIMKGVDRGDDIARAGRRARAVRTVGQMPLVHIDRNHRRMAALGKFLKAGGKLPLLAIDICLHQSSSGNAPTARSNPLSAGHGPPTLTTGLPLSAATAWRRPVGT